MQKTVILLFSAAALAAQDIPVRNWQAPFYWQPSPTEIQIGPRHAEIRTPTPNATTPAGALVFVAMTPCRVVDTRNNCTLNPALCSNAQFGPPSLTTNATRSFPIQSSSTCSIPSNAMAYSFNVTMIPNPAGSFAGYVEVWNTAAPPNTPPTAATILDFPTADIRSNSAIVPAGISNGSVSVITNATNPLDVALDINGYYAPLSGVTLALGTAASPSLSFAGFPDTGIFSVGGVIVNLSTGGTIALSVGDSGSDTALGPGALAANTSGTHNTATGYQALTANTFGANNTATGYQALGSNSSGSNNVAVGSGALLFNNSGGNNTATGFNALGANTTGHDNAAYGYNALDSNDTGTSNTAIGDAALSENTSGSDNTATGHQALAANTTGVQNTAIGDAALLRATTGNYNTAVGVSAGQNITTGRLNIGIGLNGGDSITTGSNNIDIGNEGTASDGTSSNSGVIRIGAGSQTSFFAAGIAGVLVNNSAGVVIDTTTGQLGTISSSRRYKEDIDDMRDASSGLLKLRPVTFRYQQPYADGSKPLDYGLIAEEVTEVYPDLVVKGADGEVETVQYHKLIPMLLNELQKLRAELTALKKEP